MDPFVNIAGYRFVDLPDRDELREPFREACEKNRLLGTILLSTEGINFFLCGSGHSIRASPPPARALRNARLCENLPSLLQIASESLQ